VTRTLFLSISLVYQFRPTHTANFSDFILPADASTYGENREKRGLDKNQAVICGRLIKPTITVPRTSKLIREITPSEITQ
jgi:hypothetical protein